MADGLVGGLAIIADKSVKLNAHCREAKLLGGATVSADTIARKAR